MPHARRTSPAASSSSRRAWIASLALELEARAQPAQQLGGVGGPGAQRLENLRRGRRDDMGHARRFVKEDGEAVERDGADRASGSAM